MIIVHIIITVMCLAMAGGYIWLYVDTWKFNKEMKAQGDEKYCVSFPVRPEDVFAILVCGGIGVAGVIGIFKELLS